jgi:hypothetical protein
MAGLRPGTSPPPVKIPITPFLMLPFAMSLKIALSWDAEQEIIASSAKFRKRRPTFFREGTVAKNIIE